MSAFTKYLQKQTELLDLRARVGERETEEEDELLDSMDPLWWRMRETERMLANMALDGKWIRWDGLICPHCGDRRERKGCPPRCHECMRDVIPEEV